jgi:hypothetical protein
MLADEDWDWVRPVPFPVLFVPVLFISKGLYLKFRQLNFK